MVDADKTKQQTGLNANELRELEFFRSLEKTLLQLQGQQKAVIEIDGQSFTFTRTEV